MEILESLVMCSEAVNEPKFPFMSTEKLLRGVFEYQRIDAD